MTAPLHEGLHRRIADRSALVGIVGLGYVGLPLALSFVEGGFPVLGFDVDAAKIEALARGECYIRHLDGGRLAAALAGGRLAATCDFDRLGEPDALLICVPTPLTPQREPDMTYDEGSAREVARRLRAERQEVPILFLTARDAAEDKVRGLTIGGDDYVTKPFSVEELVARIRAILRRTLGEQTDGGRLTFADLELDEDTHEVLRGGRVVDLTPTEFKLLHYLMLNPRRVLTKAQIMDRVWDYDFGGRANVVETYISYLRKKVDAEGPPLIHTVRGIGYSLRLPRD